jgi:hypothetical protein
MRIVRPLARGVGERLRGRRRETSVLILFAAWSALVFAIGAATQKSGFYGIAVRPLLEAGLNGPLIWARAQLSNPPHLEIDIKFDDFRKLAFQRERALENQSLFAADDGFVPATIRSGDENVQVKLRLKGDSVAHLQGEKWSFRVEVKGDHTLRGLQRFSLQHPATRNYLDEWVFHRALLREGVLGLRYEFVDLTLNGKNLGIYAVEEHFEKQLVEQKRRRDGPLLRFDEELLWRELHDQTLAAGAPVMTSGYGAYEASAIDGFKTGQTLADPAAREAYLHGVQLLESFRRGERRTSEVFDAKLLAKYFAVSDLMGAEHGTRWHNMRFYFNPVTLRLEPIGFDAESTQLMAPSGAEEIGRDINGRIVVDARPFRTKLFADRDFFALYMAELERVAAPGYVDELLRDLQPDLDQALQIVQREFPQVEVPVALMRRNQAYLQSLLEPVAGIRANQVKFADGRLDFEVGNLQIFPVEILGIEIPASDSTPARSVDLPAPLRMEARRYGELVHFEKASLELPADVKEPGEIQVRWRLFGTEHVQEAKLTPYSPFAPDGATIDAAHRPANLDRFPFVQVDTAAGIATIVAGSWVLDEDLIAPPGLVLRAGPGTRVDLRHGAKIISRSPLSWRGSAEAPIEVFSSDSTGQGVIVLQAGGESVVEHAIFRGLRPVDEKGWTLTGAVTFYESPVTVIASEFAGNPAEDALNVVRSRVRVDGSIFRDTLSDAFDCDFCDAEVTNSRFYDLTNDAIDVSGSTANLDNIEIERAGDKGISAGEASNVTANRVTVIAANVGVASKDRSTLTVHDLTLHDCKWGIAAFQKKPEYGPATVHITGFLIEEPAPGNLIQAGSLVVVDGVELPASDQQNIRKILYGEPPAPVAAQH